MFEEHMVVRNMKQEDNQSGQLALYKHLLQPHFLFNSLNNLYALSLKKADETPEAIAGLSHLLERVVSFSRQESVPLSEELALIKDYILLETIWLGEGAFQMDLQVKGDIEGINIPPLTIYTLVENAFKHGIRKHRDRAWLTIYLILKKDKLLLKVRNGHSPEEGEQPLAAGLGAGLGIEAVRKILDSTFRKQYHLEARSIGDVFAVDLIIRKSAA